MALRVPRDSSLQCISCIESVCEDPGCQGLCQAAGIVVKDGICHYAVEASAALISAHTGLLMSMLPVLPRRILLDMTAQIYKV